MAPELTNVLVAGYPDLETARHEFDGLVELVKGKQVRIEGAILVTHDTDGEVVVQQTGDHLGRKGLAWGGGVGSLVGLAAPPLLAATALGAAAGGIAGRFGKHRVESGIHDKIGEALPPGSAAIIAMFDDEQRLGVERALAGSPAKSVVQSDRKGVAALQDSLAEAMGKFAPDRTVLPLSDPTFGGTIGRTLGTSVADWTVVMQPKPPKDAPNVLVVLIDDAGFGNPDTFGGPIATPAMTRVRGHGPDVQPLPRHGDLLADPGGSAHRPEPAPGRIRLNRRVPRAVPGLHGVGPQELRPRGPCPEGQRLRDGRLREVAPHAGQRPGRRRAVRPLAERLGLRPLVGLPQRRRRP